MTDPYALTTCTIGVVALAVLWIGPFGKLRRDNFRTDVRRLRDELFDFMWENGYSFENKAYRETRQTLNGMLRWSNSMNTWTFVAFVCYLKESEQVPDSRPIVPHLEECDERLRSKLEDTADRVARRALHFAFFEGTVGILVRLTMWVSRAVGRSNKAETPDHRGRAAVTSEAYRFGCGIVT